MPKVTQIEGANPVARTPGDHGTETHSTFLLMHGAGSTSWYWHLVAPKVAAAGHEVLTVDLPVDDDTCGLDEYAAVAVEAVASRSGVILVAQSMAAYSAPIVATKIPVELIVLVAPMVPAPAETPGQWWANTGQPDAARRRTIEEGRDPNRSFDPIETFLHDVDPAVVAESGHHVRRQSERPFNDPWPLPRWPEIATRCVIGRNDRLFPIDFQRRVVRERLGIVADEIDAGHLPALSRPADLARLLVRYRAEMQGTGLEQGLT